MQIPVITPVRVNPIFVHPAERRLSLDGTWAFRLDPEDKGVSENWFQNPQALPESVVVPGCWQGQGHGTDENGKIYDFQLPVRTFRATYEGTGWYGKFFEVPAQWQTKRIRLNFGGVHPSAEVWLNGVKLGENHFPFVPFGFDVTDLVRPDGQNHLVVRVHEQDRLLGGSFSWQGSWSGLYRGVEITAASTFIDQFMVYPDVDWQSIRFKVNLGVAIRKSPPSIEKSLPSEYGLKPDDAPILRVSCRHADGTGPEHSVELPITENSAEFTLDVPSPQLWSPDAPNLYRIDAVLSSGGCVLDALSERTGFVKLSTEGKHFLINGEPYYMRGTGDFISCPETGCPDTDRDRWRKRLTALRAYGYNHVRCQSYVYGPEYYDIADEVGILVQSEMGSLGFWGGHSKMHGYSWPWPTPAHQKDLRSQWNLVVARDANHPSANIYCMSNELGEYTFFPRIAWQCYADTKALKPTSFVIWTDGAYKEDLPGDFVNAEAETDKLCSKPLIQHEFRWWTSFPDVSIMHKYSGAVRPYAAELAQVAAADHGIGHVLPKAAANSQRLQFLESKLKMQKCRFDNPTLAGISHFCLMDANPSVIGIIDEFYDRKFADSPTWLQTNGDTVVLCNLGAADRVMASEDTLKCAFSVSDFSHPPLSKPSLEWKLESDGDVIGSGRIDHKHIPYQTCEVGSLEIAIPEVALAKTAVLSARLSEGGRSFTNQWNLWIFPSNVRMSSSLSIYLQPKYTWLTTLNNVPVLDEAVFPAGHTVLAERLDEALVDFIRRGGRVVLCASEGLVRPYYPKLLLTEGRYFFTIAANWGPYEDGQSGTIIARHPILGDFPHEGFADLQFYRLMAEMPSLDLEPLGLNDADPVVRALHSYQVCRPLAYLTEHSMGSGRLVVCALDLNQSLPEARYLLAQMCEYLGSEDMSPGVQLSNTALDRLIEGTSID